MEDENEMKDKVIESTEKLESIIDEETGEISLYLRFKSREGSDAEQDEKAVYDNIEKRLSKYSERIKTYRPENSEGMLVMYRPSEKENLYAKEALINVIKNYFGELEIQRMGKFKTQESEGEKRFKIM